MPKPHPTSALVAGLLFALAGACASAAEGGKSLYLLGKRGPLAGLIPKPGWYVTNDLYYYSASSSELVPISGRVNQGVSAEALINLLQLTWITDLDLIGGRLALGALIPYGRVEIEATASALTPPGLPNALGKSDRVTDFGDPVLAASLGWKHRNGDLFRAWNLYSSLFIPAGSYQLGRISNIGANRWGLDVGSAFSMANFGTGREVSGVLGVTFNGENPDTDYRSGTDLHLELSARQHLPEGFAIGLAGYYYQQLTADSGSNLLGDFKGRVAALGPEISYQFQAAGRTMGLDLRWYHEFAAQNRVEGDAVFLTLSLPLQRDSAGAGAR
jgi:hypothetical protein